MSGNTTIGASVTGGEDAIPKRIAALETRVRELASVRSLNSSSIGAGGLIVNPGGTSVSLRVDENVDWANDGHLFTGAVVAFATATESDGEAALRLLDDGGTPVLEARSTSGGQGVSTLTLVEGGATLNHQTTPGVPDGSLQVSGFGIGLSYPSGGANFDSGGLVLQAGSATSHLGPDQVRCDQLDWVQQANTEWRAMNQGGSYVPVRASSFPVSSSREVKQDIHDLPFDALEAVRRALPQRWQYKPEHGDRRHHISPMADDLPAEIVDGEGAEMSIDVRDLVGVLWAAVRQLAARVDELQSTSR